MVKIATSYIQVSRREAPQYINTIAFLSEIIDTIFSTEINMQVYTNDINEEINVITKLTSLIKSSFTDKADHEADFTDKADLEAVEGTEGIIPI